MQTELHTHKLSKRFNDAVSCQDYVALLLDEWNVGTEYWCNGTDMKTKERPIPLLHACSLYIRKVTWISESTEYTTDSLASGPTRCERCKSRHTNCSHGVIRRRLEKCGNSFSCSTTCAICIKCKNKTSCNSTFSTGVSFVFIVVFILLEFWFLFPAPLNQDISVGIVTGLQVV